jgi:hypothetical protein
MCWDALCGGKQPGQAPLTASLDEAGEARDGDEIETGSEDHWGV